MFAVTSLDNNSAYYKELFKWQQRITLVSLEKLHQVCTISSLF